jgi:hypothetical protein
MAINVEGIKPDIYRLAAELEHPSSEKDQASTAQTYCRRVRPERLDRRGLLCARRTAQPQW